MGKKSRQKQLRRVEREKESPLYRGPEAIREYGFEITTEALAHDPLPPDLDKESHQLFLDLPRKPERIIPRLEQLVDQHPELPMFKNWLALAYSRVDRSADADKIIARTIKENPNYLFAKISYAEMCLGTDRVDEVPALFGGKTELNQVITDRNLFHITEFIAFYFVMAKHALLTGDLKGTHRYYRKLMLGAPDSEPVEILSKLIANVIANVIGDVALEAERSLGSSLAANRLFDLRR
jgi:hypothetical protein